MDRLVLLLALALAGCTGPTIEVNLHLDDPTEGEPQTPGQPAHLVHLQLREADLGAFLPLGEGVTSCSVVAEGKAWRVRWIDRARREGKLYLALRDSETLALYDPAFPAPWDEELDDSSLGSLVACSRPGLLGEHIVSVQGNAVALSLEANGNYLPRRRPPH